MSTATDTAIDVWLRVGDDEHDDFDPLPDGSYPAEANTYPTETGYRVDWYLTSVGLVSSVHFDTLADAYDWLEREGFANYSSGEEQP
jgi:hypothetical protein